MKHRKPRTFGRSLVELAAVLGVLGLFAAAFAVATLHLSVSPVLTGSMSPTFDPGAVLVTRQVPREDVRAGDVVAFRPPGHIDTYAHRVVSVTQHAGTPVITTRGDANPANDDWKAALTEPVARQVVFSVPQLGRLIVALHQPKTQPIALALAGLVFTTLGVRAVLSSSTATRPTPARVG